MDLPSDVREYPTFTLRILLSGQLDLVLGVGGPGREVRVPRAPTLRPDLDAQVGPCAGFFRRSSEEIGNFDLSVKITEQQKNQQ